MVSKDFVQKVCVCMELRLMSGPPLPDIVKTPPADPFQQPFMELPFPRTLGSPFPRSGGILLRELGV